MIHTDYTKLTNTRIHWDRFQSEIANPDPEDQNVFTISIALQYHHQLFQYETEFWYLLKWAFVQYVVVWITVSWAVEKLERLVYREYIMPTVRQLSDVKILLTIKEKNY